MPDDIVAALSRVAATLPPVDWPEPEQIRRTARRRRRRRAVAAAFVAVLVVGGGLGLARDLRLPAGVAPGHNGPSASAAPSCPDGLAPARVRLPDYPDIQIKVYNGTLTDGLAEEVGTQLRNRGLDVLSWSNPPSPYEGTARIVYGPEAVGAAWVTQSFFELDDAEMVFDIKRKVEWVDVTLGKAFQEIETPTEVNVNIAAKGSAVLPPGTCELD